MLNQSDKKLTQQARVCLERLQLDENNKLSGHEEKHNHESSKGSNNMVTKNQESNIPPSVKKEKKVFETIDSKTKVFLREGNPNPYSNYVKSENISLDHKKPLSSSPKEWFVNETKIEKDAKENLRSVNETDISIKGNLSKRLYSSKNDSERTIQIHNKVKPIIELVPLVAKCEEPEISTVKITRCKDRQVIDIERVRDRGNIPFTPSIQKIISQNKYATIPFTPVPYMSESISQGPISTPKTYSGTKDGLVEKAPANKGVAESIQPTLERPREDPTERLVDGGAVKSSHQTLKRPADDLLEESPVNTGDAKSNQPALKRLRQRPIKNPLDGGAEKSILWTLKRPSVEFSEESPADKSTAEYTQQTPEIPGDGQEKDARMIGQDIECNRQTLKRIKDDPPHYGYPRNKNPAESSCQTNKRTEKICVEEESPANQSTVKFSHQIPEMHYGHKEKVSMIKHDFESSHQTLRGKGDDPVEGYPTNKDTAEPSCKTQERSEDGSIKGALMIGSTTVEFSHKTLERPVDNSLEETPADKNPAQSSHQTPDMQGYSHEEKASMIGITGDDPVEGHPMNKDPVESSYQSPERPKDGFVEGASLNGDTIKSSHQTFERPGDESVEETPPKKGHGESSHQVMEIPGVSSVKEVLTNSTPKGRHTSDKLIKVKAPQALGIQSQEARQESQNICSENHLNLCRLSQIRSTSGNGSRIAEICKVYPIFFTPEVRHNITVLVNILHTASRGLTLEQIESKQYDDTCIMNIQNCSEEFVKTYNRILKLDQFGSDKDLLKKIIPIMYLHVDKAFKRLRPKENFDFRNIMKKMFDAGGCVCEHDVILEKNNEMFQKVMSTFERWLEDIFIDCDLIETLEPETNNGEKGSPSLSGSFSPDSLEEATMEVENEHTDTSEQQIDSNKKNLTEEIIECDPNVELNYLLCVVCGESLPMCFLCKELLSCPCSYELNGSMAFDKGPGSLTFCREHSKCGDDWPQWESSWSEEVEDHDMPFNPICWNAFCDKRAMLLCVCRVQAYCSRTCQVQDWTTEHHIRCGKQTDPRCYYLPQEEDMDVS